MTSIRDMESQLRMLSARIRRLESMLNTTSIGSSQVAPTSIVMRTKNRGNVSQIEIADDGEGITVKKLRR